MVKGEKRGREGKESDMIMGETVGETEAREISREWEEWGEDLLHKIVFKSSVTKNNSTANYNCEIPSD